MTPLDQLLNRVERILERVEAYLPPVSSVDWSARGFLWRKKAGLVRGYLEAVKNVDEISFSQLQHIDEQKEVVMRNTAQFMAGKPANNVLLTGARGTGKSSLIKACLKEYQAKGLRLIEVDKADLIDLPDIINIIAGRSERFIIFCDDLSFESGDAGYKALKVALDGGVTAVPLNVLIYATSNRRHLLPEFETDNETYHYHTNGDLHPGETVEEKISLSERFGIWLSFYSFDQTAYLNIVASWLSELGCAPAQIEAARGDALRWALQRGSRSGRVALQFAKDYVGRLGAA
jgi:predicted AAA+ superfamily ATPase